MKYKEILILSDAYTAVLHGMQPIVPDTLTYRPDLLPDLRQPTPETADRLEAAIQSHYRQLGPADRAKLKQRPVSPDTLALFEIEELLHRLSSARYAALSRGHDQRADVLDRVYTRLRRAPRVSPTHDADRIPQSAN